MMSAAKPPSRILGSECFVGVFREYFDLGHVDLGSRLAEDLAMDSIMMVELLLFLEELAERPLPDQLLAEIKVVSDIFHYYQLFSSQNHSEA
jgi:acyl carrier protein